MSCFRCFNTAHIHCLHSDVLCIDHCTPALQHCIVHPTAHCIIELCASSCTCTLPPAPMQPTCIPLCIANLCYKQNSTVLASTRRRMKWRQTMWGLGSICLGRERHCRFWWQMGGRARAKWPHKLRNPVGWNSNSAIVQLSLWKNTSAMGENEQHKRRRRRQTARLLPPNAAQLGLVLLPCAPQITNGGNLKRRQAPTSSGGAKTISGFH